MNKKPISELIIHIGLHKTGSASVQHSLARNDLGSGVTYLSGDVPNGSLMISSVFNPTKELVSHKLAGLSRAQDQSRRGALRDALEIGIESCNSEKLIISAEAFATLSPAQFKEAFDWFSRYAARIRVIGYVRSPKAHKESEYAWAVSRFPSPFPPRKRNFFYKKQLNHLFETCGSENITLKKFERHHLLNGDVVQDFLQQAGLRLDAHSLIRANESISLSGARLVYAYWKTFPFAVRVGPAAAQLRKLPGPPVRLHSELAKKVINAPASQLRWLEEKTGASFDDDWSVADEVGLRSEADMLNFDKESLEWLGHRTNIKVSTLRKGFSPDHASGRC